MTKKTVLITGEEIEVYDDEFNIDFTTNTPGKWRLINLETGKCWRPTVHGYQIKWAIDAALQNLVARNVDKL